MESRVAVKATKGESSALIAILAVAAALGGWGLPSYFPYFWDEARYVSEVEGLGQHIGVNVGSFVFLKLGYTLFGLPSYPQIVTALFGVLTVLGLYVLGRRIFNGERQGITLGLFMAGQAALMPYFVRYSQHALAAGFAQCFLVYALYIYLARLHRPRVAGPADANRYLGLSLLAAGMLAMVPACSFKFLLPTLLLFIALEVFLWWARNAEKREYRATRNLIFSIVAGLVLYFILPWGLSVVAGYGDWLNRVIVLTKGHAVRETLRPAFHFLYPLQLYYLSGPVFIICASAGLLLLFVKFPRNMAVTVRPAANNLLLLSFAAYFLFFGILSHLQAARVYVLTLPFLVYASAMFFLKLRHALTRRGTLAAGVLYLLLLGSLGYLTAEYLSKTSGLKAASDVLMKNCERDQLILSSSGAQIYYCAQNSPYYQGKPFSLEPLWTRLFLKSDEWMNEGAHPPLLVLQDGVNLAVIVHEHGSRDLLAELGIDGLRKAMQTSASVVHVADCLFAAPDNFYTSPHYYLEMVYGWDSYLYIRELMPHARDSIFIYRIKPAPSQPGR